MVCVGTARWGASQGAQFLDQRVPGWFHRIDVNRLDIGNGRECVLGQLYGFYDTGLKQLGIGWWRVPGFGFPLPLLGSLNKAWRMEVASRRSAAAPAVR